MTTIREHLGNGHGWLFPAATTEADMSVYHERDHAASPERESFDLDEHTEDHEGMQR